MQRLYVSYLFEVLLPVDIGFLKVRCESRGTASCAVKVDLNLFYNVLTTFLLYFVHFLSPVGCSQVEKPLQVEPGNELTCEAEMALQSRNNL